MYICKPWTKPPKRYSLKSSVKGLKMKTRVSILPTGMDITLSSPLILDLVSESKSHQAIDSSSYFKVQYQTGVLCQSKLVVKRDPWMH